MLRCADLPIEEIRPVIDDETGAVVRHVLAVHCRRLERQRELLTARIRNAERYIEKGIPMTDVRPGCWPVQMKIAVDDVDTAVEFYVKAFGLTYDAVQHTEHGDYSAFMFGTYGHDDFFLLHLIASQEHMDRPGQSTFGLLVDDVDERHSRAVGSGATEVVTPGESEGMPRRSAVRDPSGNWIWLYQA